MVLGGGYSPSGNEVSLESNVKYLHRQKDKIGLSKFKIKPFLQTVWTHQETLNTATQFLQYRKEFNLGGDFDQPGGFTISIEIII